MMIKTITALSTFALPLATMSTSAQQRDYAWYVDLGFGKRPYEELYDLKNAPHEVNNLAWHPDYQKIRKELGGRLDQTLISTDDPRISEGLCIYDSPEFVNLRE